MLVFIGNLPRAATLVELEKILGRENLKVRCSSHRGERKTKVSIIAFWWTLKTTMLGAN